MPDIIPITNNEKRYFVTYAFTNVNKQENEANNLTLSGTAGYKPAKQSPLSFGGSITWLGTEQILREGLDINSGLIPYIQPDVQITKPQLSEEDTLLEYMFNNENVDFHTPNSKKINAKAKIEKVSRIKSQIKIEDE